MRAETTAAPPREADLVRLGRVLARWRRITRPQLHGLDRLPPDGRVLLVGNHSLYGLFDVPLLVSELYSRKGLMVRGLGDRGHFRIPLWRSLFRRCGAVEATRDNCRALMRTGAPVLVYPGGAREAHKRRGESYKLLWEGRQGFAELAIENRYPVVPFAAVGGDDLYDIVIDRDDPRAAWARTVLAKLGARPEVLPPVGRGWRGTPLPRPRPIAFAFGDPIDPAAPDYGTAGAAALKERVAARVEEQITTLRAA